MVDRISKERRSWNMSRIRGKDTKPERVLRSLLHWSGFRFRLHDPALPGRPDIVLKKYRAAIFVHGCYWHRHPGCPNATTPGTRQKFWKEKFDRTVERDRQKAAELTALGWRVVTVWECELERDPAAVLSNIRHQLVEARHAA
jgi:DNA mismatch endonuclease (patch repair protein)